MGSAWKPFQREERAHLELLFASSSLAHTFSSQATAEQWISRAPELCVHVCAGEISHISIDSACSKIPWVCPCASPASQQWMQGECQSSVGENCLTVPLKSLLQKTFSLTNTCYRYIFILSKDILLLSFFSQKTHPHRPDFYVLHFTWVVLLKQCFKQQSWDKYRTYWTYILGKYNLLAYFFFFF